MESSRKLGIVKIPFLTLAFLAAGCASPMELLQPVKPSAGSAPLHIYVADEVLRPGAYRWTNGITAADAIELAGGFTDFVPSRWLYIDHWDGSRERYRLTRDYRLQHNTPLKPGDKVYTFRR